jgi:Protein of unknown function (DUF3304)
MDRNAMKKYFTVVLSLVCVTLLNACHATLKEEMFGGSLTGIDHLSEDYLSVSDFSINGAGGAQAGKGGRTVCCAPMPMKWHQGMTAHVKWDVSDWKDSGHGGKYETDAPVDPYTTPGHIYVHFLADRSVRVVVSNVGGPRSHDYPGPHDPIPNKEPWNKYPPPVDERPMSEQLKALKSK